MTRSEGRVDEIRAQGGEPVVCDVFDADRVRAVVVAAQPDVVIHQLTDIPPRLHPRRVNKELAPTNRLRAEGTQNLMMAATAAGPYGMYLMTEQRGASNRKAKAQ